MTCKSCGSDRCGNHAACERRTARFREWQLSTDLTWKVIGTAEMGVQALLKAKGDAAIRYYGGIEDMRADMVTRTLVIIERLTR